jgi:outer membrane protein TolC
MTSPISKYIPMAFIGLFLALPAMAQTPLKLSESVAIALQANDPSAALFEERALALEERAVADSQLPDPTFMARMQNVPLSSLDINREGMTQLSLGVRQAFPKGKTRSLTRKKRLSEAQSERMRKTLTERQIALQTRTAWLELYYWQGARKITEESRAQIADLGGIAEAVFATGRSAAQNVLRIDLETSLLDAKLVDIDRKADVARADLIRLIGIANAARPLPEAFPVLPPFPDAKDMQAGLVRHPSVKVFDAKMDARARDVDIAGEQYKPGFSVDASYGARDSRSDFGSVGVALSIPLFTAKRQDKSLNAAKRMKASTRLGRDAQLLELNRELGRNYAEWVRLGERISLYETDVLLRAKDTAEAALIGYENETADFAELVRAELAVLNTELTLLRLRIDREKSHAALLYLNGENNE